MYINTVDTNISPTMWDGITDAIVSAAWAVCRIVAAYSTVPDKQWAHVQQQFLKKYGCTPKIDTRFEKDGLYTCTIRHLDGVVIGEGRASLEAVAVDLAAEAVGFHSGTNS